MLKLPKNRDLTEIHEKPKPAFIKWLNESIGCSLGDIVAFVVLLFVAVLVWSYFFK